MSYDWVKRVEPGPKGPVCDFCGAEMVFSVFAAEPHIVMTSEVPGMTIDHGSEGSWAACQACDVFINMGSWKELEDRAVRMMTAGMGMTWKERHELRMNVRQIHSRFREHYRRPA